MNPNPTFLAFGSAILLGAALVYGCGDDAPSGAGTSSGGPGVDAAAADTGAGASSTSSSSSSSSSSSGSSGAVDAGTKPPPLGAQIDRFGRPAISTALIKIVEVDAGAADRAKDDYNADSDRAGWVAKYQDPIARSLALYDCIDAVCGNQPLADASAGNNTPVTRYGTLATLLADDRQWMNTAGTEGATNEYLAVELNAVGALPNTLVGGRKLSFDVVDRSYGVLSGIQPLGDGLTDGVSKVPAKTDGTTFPYLAGP